MYKIASSKFESFKAKIEFLNKKAIKIGVSPVYISISKEETAWVDQKFNIGEKVRAVATVKKHATYNGNNSTVLTRVKFEAAQ